MADDVTVDSGGSGGSSGGGNFLTRKQGPLPMWVWIAGFVGAVLIYRSMSGGSLFGGSASSTTSNTAANGSNGNGTTPNIFFLPQGANPDVGGNTIPVTLNRNPGNGGSTGQNGVIQGASPPRGGPSRTVPADQQSMMGGIADHFGTGVESLTTLNNVSNPNLVYPGEGA